MDGNWRFRMGAARGGTTASGLSHPIQHSFMMEKAKIGGLQMLQAKYFIGATPYHDEEAVIQDALRHLLRARPELRIRMAVFRYQHEDMSLAKAASLAGVSWAQMKDILLEQGIALRLGVETLEDAQQDIEVLRQELGAST